MKHVNLEYLVKSYYKQMVLERYYISHHIKLDFSGGYVVPYKELHYIYYRCLLNASKKIKISQNILFSFYNEWDPINAYKDHIENPIGYIIAERIRYLCEENFISSKEVIILLNELTHLTKVSYSEKLAIISNIKCLLNKYINKGRELPLFFSLYRINKTKTNKQNIVKQKQKQTVCPAGKYSFCPLGKFKNGLRPC